MGMDMDTKIRKFHQAKWDEPIIFELSTPGERGVIPPQPSEDLGQGSDVLNDSMKRKEKAALPELSQPEVLRHYLRMSQENLGADLNVDIGQGTCTMKYNPKINEKFVMNEGLAEMHPLQDESTAQGILEIIYNLDSFMQEISGLDKFTFQPGGGSHAILGIVEMIEKYHRENGEGEKRDEIISTAYSHPSDQAAAAAKGYKIITIYPNDQGYPDIEALKEAVSERTAGLLITNPEDIGIFNPDIKEFTEVVHDFGGLCGYDQANANGILGMTRALEAGFDFCFFNLHKTFSSPHGCGGPATGALGARNEFVDYLPAPLVRKEGEKYYLDYDLKHSIGNIREFFGTIPAVLRAYAWIRSLGSEGLREVAKVAVLNNNYILKNIRDLKGARPSYNDADEKLRVEQVRYTWEELVDETGVNHEDIQRRIFDFGMHLWSSHHPFLVPEPFTIEPTEAYSKKELDEYLSVLRKIVKEAYEEPEKVKNAPHNSVIHKIDESWLDDPEKWAMSWRSYLKKHKREN